jgi:hypothetical protein
MSLESEQLYWETKKHEYMAQKAEDLEARKWAAEMKKQKAAAAAVAVAVAATAAAAAAEAEGWTVVGKKRR